MRATRLLDRPIIDADTHPSLGSNIAGPSLIRSPHWVGDPLGEFYLYFADHKGDRIKLAHADELTGPWTVHADGALTLEQSGFLTQPPAVSDDQIDEIEVAYAHSLGAEQVPVDLRADLVTPHIASPDVHIDAGGQRIVMYYHGLAALGRQTTRVAISRDGIGFQQTGSEVCGTPYLRTFRHAGGFFGLSMPAQLEVGAGWTTEFSPAHRFFDDDIRHAAVLARPERAYVFFTRVGEAPERILVSTIDLVGDPDSWRASEPVEVLRPEREWEGSEEPLEPSRRGAALGPCNQLRDPAVFEHEGRVFLLYAIAGERGIAIAELEL